MSADAITPPDLTDAEVRAMARRILARHASTDSDWLMWEDYPLLGERTFARLHDAVDQLAREADDEADAYDRAEDIDSMLLLERATD